MMRPPLHPARPRRLYLMRHGEVSYFSADGTPLDPRTVPLTETGRAQASALAPYMADICLDRVCASPLPRTQETARLATGERYPVEVWEDFKEIRAGRLRDLPSETRRQQVAAAYRPAGETDAVFLGGEAFGGFADRVIAGFERLCFGLGQDWSSALLVAHDAVNRVILAHVLGCGLAALEGLEQDLAGVSVLDLAETQTALPGGSAVVVRAMNITAHDLMKKDLRLSSMEWVAQSV